MSRTKFRFLCKFKAKIRTEVEFCLKTCLSNRLFPEANLMKLHKKIKHNGKVCCALEFSSVSMVKVYYTIRN